MNIAENIYTPFQKGLFYLFWLCPGTFEEKKYHSKIAEVSLITEKISL
jgi:hypothetical protein